MLEKVLKLVLILVFNEWGDIFNSKASRSILGKGESRQIAREAGRLLKLEVKYLLCRGCTHTPSATIRQSCGVCAEGRHLSYTSVLLPIRAICPLPLPFPLQPCLCLAFTHHYLGSLLLSPESFLS